MLKAIAASAGGSAAGITIGTSVITSGTNTRVLFDDNGVVGESAGLTYVKATGTLTMTAGVIGAGAAITSSGAGGALGTAAFVNTGTSGATVPLLNAANTFSGNLTISSASLITSGNLSAAAWTTAGIRAKMIAASYTDTSSSGTVAAAYTDLFGAGTILASSATTYTSYYGAYFVAPVASTNVTMTNKSALGADTVSIGGAAQSTFALAVTGTSQFSSSLTLTSGNITIGSGDAFKWTNRTTFFSPADGTVQITNNNGSIVSYISLPVSASLQFGQADAAVAVAQTTRVQSVVAGTADIAGANWTLDGSVSTGAGVPGDIILKVAGKGAASTTQNTLLTALTIKGGTTNNTNVGQPSIVLGSAAIATTATDGFLYIATSAGAPAGTPTAFTGRVALCYDTTNHQFWIYDGAWLQPKTPAAAATVTWQ